MNIPPKRVRFEEFLSRLSLQPPAGSRQAAYDMMDAVMKSVEEEYYVGRDFQNGMNCFPWEYGWKNLDGDPCTWKDSFAGKYMTAIYHNGRIVITRIESGKIVLDKQ